MPLKLQSATGSITLIAEDGSGNVNATLPRAGIGSVSTLSDLSVTSTAAELNVLDGIPGTLTATEIGYLDGVTSAIQTQIDAKAPTASPALTGTVTAVDLTLSGDLTVNGTTTTVASTNTTVADGLIELANGATGTPVNDSGIVIERGSADNAFIGFDESADKFIVGTGTFTGASTGDLTVTTGTLVANVEGNVTGDLTGDVTATAVTVNGTLDIEEVFERVGVTQNTASTFNLSLLDQAILYFNADQTTNKTINIRGDGSNSLNSVLSIGQSVTCTALMQQGSTAYYINAYQVDGSAVTPKWSGGSAPTGGNASGIDVYTFTIIKTADATFTVLASQTQFA